MAQAADRSDAHGGKSLLRFITCGSVDDGKSTLIGRLLHDSALVLEDQMARLEADSAKFGTQGADIDFALLVDGLAAEREQGITIDVAWRYFATARRKFIVADTPGHEQYTRNMATGASTTELAVLLVDARKGMTTQTRRHATIVSLMGVRHLVLAVNKMDLVDFDEARFREIEADFSDFVARLADDKAAVTSIPISALKGDNVTTASEHMPWYDGPTVVAHLETIDVASDRAGEPFRLPVQLAVRPDQSFRGFAGQLSSGSVAAGDAVAVLPSGRKSVVKSIVTMDGELETAVAGQSVTLTLEDEIDVARGDVFCPPDVPAGVANQFEVTLIWMGDEPMLPGRPYAFKLASANARATITSLKHAINVNTGEKLAASKLELNEIATCNISLDRRIAFDAYSDNRDIGGFILIDRLTNHTVGAGMIHFALRRSSNIQWQSLDVDKRARAAMKDQRSAILWFTGLSGAGKSTIANLVEKKLAAMGKHTYTLDGDNVRHGLNRDLGFTDADRVENIRRIGEVARLMIDAGLITLVSFISPFRSERRLARELVGEGEFIEIHVDTPLEVAESRDVKGLYKKARAGEIKNFTGIDSPYEPPQNPEIRVDTAAMSAEDAADEIIEHLVRAGIID